MENYQEFLDAMRPYVGGMANLDDAIAYALDNSERIDSDSLMFMAEFPDGTFYSDSNGSQWFPDMTPYSVKLELREQFMQKMEEAA